MLEKDTRGSFGLTIVGGEATSSLDLGIFIKSVSPGGAADRDGRIGCGDRLIAINGISLEGKQHHEAVALIRDAGSLMEVIVSRVHSFDTQNALPQEVKDYEIEREVLDYTTASNMAALMQLENDESWQDNSNESLGSPAPPLPSIPPPVATTWNDDIDALYGNDDVDNVLYGNDDVDNVLFGDNDAYDDSHDDDDDIVVNIEDSIHQSVYKRPSPDWLKIDKQIESIDEPVRLSKTLSQPGRQIESIDEPVRLSKTQSQPGRQLESFDEPVSIRKDALQLNRQLKSFDDLNDLSKPIPPSNDTLHPNRQPESLDLSMPSRLSNDLMQTYQPLESFDNLNDPSKRGRYSKDASQPNRQINDPLQPIQHTEKEDTLQWETYDGIPVSAVTSANQETAENNLTNPTVEPNAATYSDPSQQDEEEINRNIPDLSVAQARQSEVDEMILAGARTPVQFRSGRISPYSPDGRVENIPGVSYHQAYLKFNDVTTGNNIPSYTDLHTDLQHEGHDSDGSYEEEISVTAYGHANAQIAVLDKPDMLTQEVVTYGDEEFRVSDPHEVFDNVQGSQDGDLNSVLQALREDSQLTLDLQADSVEWSGHPLEEDDDENVWTEAEKGDLQLLGDIAALDEDGSSSDSDFDTAIRKTVEGTKRKSQPHRLVHPVSPLQAGPLPVLGDMDVGVDEILYEIILERDDSLQPFGIITQTMHSPTMGQEGLYIKAVTEGSPAHQGGILQTGDRMLEINGQRVSGLSASQAHAVLNSPQHMCTVKVARHKNSDNFLDVEDRHEPWSDSLPTPPPPPLPFSSPPHSDRDPTIPREVTHSLDESIPIVPPPPAAIIEQEVDSCNDTHSDVDSDVWNSGGSDVIQDVIQRDKADTLEVRPVGMPVVGLDKDKVMENGRRFGPAVSDGKLPGGGPQESSASADVTQSEAEDDFDGAVKDEAVIGYEPEIVKVEVTRKAKVGFGFTVAGGSGTGGCYIKQLIAAPASQKGCLLPGDKILKVNDKDTTTLTHTKAVSMLRKGPDTVTLTLLRYPPAISSQERLMMLKAIAEKRNEVIESSDDSKDVVPQLSQSANAPREATPQEMMAPTIDAKLEVKPGQVDNMDEPAARRMSDNMDEPDARRMSDESIGSAGSDSEVDGRTMSLGQRSRLSYDRSNEPKPDYSDSEAIVSPPPDYPMSPDLINQSQRRSTEVSQSVLESPQSSPEPPRNFPEPPQIWIEPSQRSPELPQTRLIESSRQSSDEMSQGSQGSNEQLSQAASPVPYGETSHSDDDTEQLKENEKDSTVIPSDKPHYSLRRVDSEIPVTLTQDWLASLPLMTQPDTESQTVPATDILQSLVEMVESGEPMEEFKNLRQVKETDCCQIGQLTENRLKNRFRNILPYDDNRVILGLPSDYINASYINVDIGSHGTLEYVACQQPLPTTLHDWWEMVWQLNTTVVVCLAGIKGQPHWIGQGSSMTLDHSGRVVRLLERQALEEFDVYSVLQEDRATSACKRVTVLHYTSWPQQGTPDTALPLLKLLRAMHVLSRGRRPVVYCSAGVGRTGVLLSMDVALASIELGEQCDMYEIVSKLRKQRHGMIQTTEQYLFCYTACMEALLSLEMAD